MIVTISNKIFHGITIIDIIEHKIYVTAVAIYIDFMSFQSTRYRDYA
jgi:hypothetical protein